MLPPTEMTYFKLPEKELSSTKEPDLKKNSQPLLPVTTMPKTNFRGRSACHKQCCLNYTPRVVETAGLISVIAAVVVGIVMFAVRPEGTATSNYLIAMSVCSLGGIALMCIANIFDKCVNGHNATG